MSYEREMVSAHIERMSLEGDEHLALGKEAKSEEKVCQQKLSKVFRALKSGNVDKAQWFMSRHIFRRKEQSAITVWVP